MFLGEVCVYFRGLGSLLGFYRDLGFLFTGMYVGDVLWLVFFIVLGGFCGYVVVCFVCFDFFL